MTEHQVSLHKVEKILLHRIRLEAQAWISPELADALPAKMSVFLDRDICTRQLVCTLTAEIAAQRVKTIRWPASWWEALKHSVYIRSPWLSRLFEAKHPVRFASVDVLALYPKVRWPNQPCYLYVDASEMEPWQWKEAE